MYTYAWKTSQAIWRVSMDQCYPDGLTFTAGATRGLLADCVPASLVTLRSVDRDPFRWRCATGFADVSARVG
jgi:hypothetical protein